MRVWARWVQGLIIKLMKFFATLKMLKKRNTRLEKCYGHVNIATAFKKKEVVIDNLRTKILSLSCNNSLKLIPYR